jgi:lipopolysaccharide/colanic/teichoic acid biosynthesis glycosyltransferase
MKRFETFGLSFGFLILAGTPPYLVYDVHRLTQGNSTFFHWFNLILAVGAVVSATGWLFSLRGESYLRFRSYWERLFAFIVLVFSSPFLLLTGYLIRREDNGPAIFSQERIGKNRRKSDRRRRVSSAESPVDNSRRSGDRREEDFGGKPFKLYKLRSMRTDAEDVTGAAWSTGDRDPRVTGIGHFIRRTHLDEVPQFFNVMRGEMSIIGPRPERPAFITKLSRQISDYRYRLNAPPGITGLAQIHLAADESIEDVREKLTYDKEYIDNSCLLMDIKIALKTVGLILILIARSLKGRSVDMAEPKPADRLLTERVHIPRR